MVGESNTPVKHLNKNIMSNLRLGYLGKAVTVSRGGSLVTELINYEGNEELYDALFEAGLEGKVQVSIGDDTFIDKDDDGYAFLNATGESDGEKMIECMLIANTDLGNWKDETKVYDESDNPFCVIAFSKADIKNIAKLPDATKAPARKARVKK